MKKIFASLVFLGTLLLAHNLLSAQHRLVKLWETDSVLKTPESVLFDAAGKVLYTTNIGGSDPWAKDGNGSVGKVGPDGKIITAEWVVGLHAPKGMGLYNGKLYVADLNELIVIDIAGSKIDKKISVAGAEGLNDVSIDKNGVVYVSDSKAKKIFKVKDDVSELLLDNLKGPNGVFMHGSDLFILDAGTMYRVNADKSLFKITDGMEGGSDGLEHIGNNDFIATCWQGVVWYINSDGTKEQLLDTRSEKKNTADIGIDIKNRVIYVPTFFKNTIVAYQVK